MVLDGIKVSEGLLQVEAAEGSSGLTGVLSKCKFRARSVGRSRVSQRGKSTTNLEVNTEVSTRRLDRLLGVGRGDGVANRVQQVSNYPPARRGSLVHPSIQAQSKPNPSPIRSNPASHSLRHVPPSSPAHALQATHPPRKLRRTASCLLLS